MNIEKSLKSEYNKKIVTLEFFPNLLQLSHPLMGGDKGEGDNYTISQYFK